MRTKTREIVTDLFLTKEEGDAVLKVLNIINDIVGNTDLYLEDVFDDFREELSRQSCDIKKLDEYYLYIGEYYDN